MKERVNKQHSSLRLMTAIRFGGLMPLISNAAHLRENMKGTENLSNLPQNAKVIFATTHLSDADIPIAAYALGNKFDVAISTQSTQRRFPSGGLDSIAQFVAGRKNFYPISYRRTKNSTLPLPLNPDDYASMENALDHGKAMIVAGHNPSYDGQLPQKGGMGAVFLSELSGAFIIPVAVKTDRRMGSVAGEFSEVGATLRRLVRRPKAEVVIGKPFQPEGIDTKIYTTLLGKQAQDKLSQEEYIQLAAINSQLRARSQNIMYSFQELLK